MLSLALAAYGVALTRQWSMPLATRQWSKTYIAPLGFGQTELQCKRPGWSDAASAVHLGEAVVQVPNAASTAEIEQLVAISSDIAEDERAQCVEGAVRLHVPSRLPAADASVCDTILRRMLDFVDAEFPELVADLYGDSTLKELHERGGLVFSATEPAINVYYEDGCFLPHEDNCALTVLLPLSSPSDGAFTGGGTGFWAPEPRREEGDDVAPSLVLTPPAGTALLFAGHVTHAGMTVLAGKRHCLVASFSRKWHVMGCIQRAECFPTLTWQ